MKILVASFLIMSGLVIVAVSLVAILDPEGTQMADDGDPFGEPSRSKPLAVAAVGVALVTAGSWLGKSWWRQRSVAERSGRAH